MSYPPKEMIEDIKRQFKGEFESWITYKEDGTPEYHWRRKEENK